MAMNPNWPRWIFASLSKHFYDRRGGYAFYIEGQERDVPAPPQLIELRVDGPYATELTMNHWRLYTEVSVLVQCTKDMADYHLIHRITGLVAAAFTDLPVYKYGDGDDDDQTQFGCMQLIQDIGRRERIQINNFGQISQDVPLLQSSIEGHYELLLST